MDNRRGNRSLKASHELRLLSNNGMKEFLIDYKSYLIFIRYFEQLDSINKNIGIFIQIEHIKYIHRYSKNQFTTISSLQKKIRIVIADVHTY